MIEKLIENFNFNEKEAKIYLASLSLGKSKVSEIAKKAHLNRITTYEVLKRFKQRGLANSITHDGVLLFQVIEPNRLLEKMERQVALSRNLLPQLTLLKHGSREKPKIEYYEGAEGIKALFEDTLFCKNKIIYDIAHPENLLNTVSNEYFKNFVKKRVSKNIKVKLLLPWNEINAKYKNEEKTALREVKFFDGLKYPIPNEIMIYDNKVSLLSFSDKIGVIIEDSEIAQSMKSIWQLLWDSVS